MQDEETEYLKSCPERSKVVVVVLVVVVMVVFVLVLGLEVVQLVVLVVVVVVVVVVVLVVLVVGLMVVLGVVGVLVLRVCSRNPLALQSDKGLGHHLQFSGLQRVSDSWAGSGVGFDEDQGRGAPCPWVGLAGAGGGLSGPDRGALGDGDVDECLDGIVLRGFLRGGGSCSG